MQTNDAERVERLGVARAALDRLFEPRLRELDLAPSRRAHPAFERARGRIRRDARGLVVLGERFVEFVRELVRVTELDLRRRIAFLHARAKLLDLRLRRAEIAVEAEEPNQ